MSFERIDINNKEIGEGRSCILVCNFNGKDLNLVKSYGKIIGIKDQIIVSHKNGDSIIKDIIDNKISSDCTNGSKDRAVIFNNVSNAKMNVFIENLKKLRINNVLIATVTDTSKEWSLNTVLQNLVAERIALKTGKTPTHTL